MFCPRAAAGRTAAAILPSSDCQCSKYWDVMRFAQLIRAARPIRIKKTFRFFFFPLLLLFLNLPSVLPPPPPSFVSFPTCDGIQIRCTSKRPANVAVTDFTITITVVLMVLRNTVTVVNLRESPHVPALTALANPGVRHSLSLSLLPLERVC